MPQFLVAVYHPVNYAPSLEDKAMMEEIHALNRDMIAAGVRKLACGLTPPAQAAALHIQPDRSVIVTDGPYLEAKEHVGGFWILECADMDAAVEWGRRAVVACRAGVEVRGIFFHPDAA